MSRTEKKRLKKKKEHFFVLERSHIGPFDRFGGENVEIGTIVLSRDSDLTDRPRGIDQIDRT